MAGGAWQELPELAQGYGWVVRELESSRNLPMPGKFRESGPTEDVAFPVTFGNVVVQYGDAERSFFYRGDIFLENYRGLEGSGTFALWVIQPILRCLQLT